MRPSNALHLHLRGQCALRLWRCGAGPPRNTRCDQYFAQPGFGLATAALACSRLRSMRARCTAWMRWAAAWVSASVAAVAESEAKAPAPLLGASFSSSPLAAARPPSETLLRTAPASADTPGLETAATATPLVSAPAEAATGTASREAERALNRLAAGLEPGGGELPKLEALPQSVAMVVVANDSGTRGASSARGTDGWRSEAVDEAKRIAPSSLLDFKLWCKRSPIAPSRRSRRACSVSCGLKGKIFSVSSFG
mmetsp:Transcript_85423/g.190781  ORF Transcript_85423/g.190781 Transcript_85423/m.190781 type:complete len:254 (+) Transcript_85423:73-834(+)